MSLPKRTLGRKNRRSSSRPALPLRGPAVTAQLVGPIPLLRNRGGRPHEYTEAIGAEICERLAAGESLSRMCRDEHLPGKSTVMRWLATSLPQSRQHPELVEFRDQYAHARAMQADFFADEILEIADDGRNDWIERVDGKGDVQLVFNHEHVQRSKLRIDTRKWLAAKMAPKKYGDKVDVNAQVGQDALRAIMAACDGETTGPPSERYKPRGS